MALPGFRPTVSLTENPPRLTDSATGRTLTLSTGEARLLSFFDGVRTADQLAQLAQAEGFNVDGLHVQGLLERVAHAGFMIAAPLDLSESHELQNPSDPVPALRSDLTIARSAKSGAVLEVTDPTRGQAFSLYDFEVSIARMLNGQRTASQVIEAAARIGIPVTLESLRKFVKQLRAYRFLADPPAVVEQRPGGTWSPRQVWKPEVRELYQTALRRFRAGKLGEASDYVIALLQIDAENAEARELQRLIDEKLEQMPKVEVDLNFDELHGGSDSAGEFVEAGPTEVAQLSPGPGAEHLPPGVAGIGPPRLTPEPLGLSAVSPSVVRRTMFDRSVTELTDEPLAADLGAPLDLRPREPGLPPPGGGEPEAFEWKPASPILTGSGEHEAPKASLVFAERPSEGAVDVVPLQPQELTPIANASPEAQQAISLAEAVWTPPAARPPSAAPSRAAPTKAPSLTRKRSKGPWIALGVLVALAVAGAIPVPIETQAACELELTPAGVAIASTNTRLRALPVKDGAKVKAGDPVALLDVKPLEALLEEADRRIAAANEQLDAIDRKVKPRLRAKAEAALAKAQKPVDKLVAAGEWLLAQKAKLQAEDQGQGRIRRALASTEKKLAANGRAKAKAELKVAAARRALDKVLLADQRKPFEEKIDEAKAAKALTQQQIADASIKAPADGVWRRADKKPGDKLAAGDSVGVVLNAASLGVRADPALNAPAVLLAGGTERPVSLSAGAAVVDNASGALQPGACTLRVDAGKRPLARKLLAQAGVKL